MGRGEGAEGLRELADSDIDPASAEEDAHAERREAKGVPVGLALEAALAVDRDEKILSVR